MLSLSVKGATCRSIASCLGVAVVCAGCFSAATRDLGAIGGGSASTEDKAKAAALDVVTLPAQAVLLPSAVIVGAIQAPERRAAREKREREKQVLGEWRQKIRDKPMIVVEEDYLNKDPSSWEYRSIDSFVGRNRDYEFPLEVYEYLYYGSDTENHRHIHHYVLSNFHVPEEILIDAHKDMMASRYHKNFRYISVLMNRRLPLELLAEATGHESERIRSFAESMYEQRKIQ